MMENRLHEIKRIYETQVELGNRVINLNSLDFEWLLERAEQGGQIEILHKIKELINDENLTKSETVDKISKIVNS